MGTHPKSIDAIGVIMLGKEAQKCGAREVENMAFTILLKAALLEHPHLRLVLYTNDRYGEDPEETALDLIGVVHIGTNLRLRAPTSLLTKRALNLFNKAIGDEDVEPRWQGRRSGRAKSASKEEISMLTARLLRIAPAIPADTLEGVGQPRTAPVRYRALETI